MVFYLQKIVLSKLFSAALQFLRLTIFDYSLYFQILRSILPVIPKRVYSRIIKAMSSTMETDEDKHCEEVNPKFITEGMAKVAFEGPTFYNPVQQFNRDLTVCVLRQFVRGRFEERDAKVEGEKKEEEDDGESIEKTEKDNEPPAKKQKKFQIEEENGSIRILDALSASGLRAFRFVQEVPHVSSILANDFSENAVETIRKNIELNGVKDRVTAHFGDAIMTMMDHRSIDKRFHAVDVDPYGSASQFLDSAVQCVADRGILMVTCTDMAVLCGNTPESCYNKYDAIPIRLRCCHEMALRILLRSIDSHANRYSRYIEPLVCISVDFYVRVFVRMHTGARQAKDSATKVSRLLSCSGCHSMELHPIIRKVVNGTSVRFSPNIAKTTLIGGDDKCVHCGHSVHEGGPLYTAPIHNKEFVKGILEDLSTTPESARLGTHHRLMGILSVVSEELDDVPLYYEHDQLANVVKCTVPKAINIRSAILNGGYRVSGSHANPRAIKTDAPPSFLWDICRTVAKDTKVNVDRLKDELPGKAILKKPIDTPINFTLHSAAQSQSKNDQLVRFQCNKGKNWGPRPKAKGSVNSVKAGFQVDVAKIEKK